MSRPKIKQEEKKRSFSISLSPEIMKKLNKISNRSFLIDELLKKYFENYEKIN